MAVAENNQKKVRETSFFYLSKLEHDQISAIRVTKRSTTGANDAEVLTIQADSRTEGVLGQFVVILRLKKKSFISPGQKPPSRVSACEWKSKNPTCNVQ